MADRVLPAVLGLLRERGAISEWTLDRTTVGNRTILLELINATDARRLGGLAHRPGESGDSVAAETVEALLNPIETAENAARLDLAAAIATLNALSTPFIDWQRGDPMELLSSDVETVVTVGLFKPAMGKFDDIELRIVEREDCAPPSQVGVAVSMFSPEEAETAIAGADVVFITGSTLIYGGLDRYLGLAPAGATVVLVGATASFLPAPLFDAGVDILAGAIVSDPVQVRDAVRRGACGTDLHTSGVEKTYVLADAINYGDDGVRFDV